MKDFVVIAFYKYFKSTEEKMYFKLREEKNPEIFLNCLYLSNKPDKVEKYAEMIHSSTRDNCIYHHNITILNLL